MSGYPIERLWFPRRRDEILFGPVVRSIAAAAAATSVQTSILRPDLDFNWRVNRITARGQPGATHSLTGIIVEIVDQVDTGICRLLYDPINSPVAGDEAWIEGAFDFVLSAGMGLRATLNATGAVNAHTLTMGVVADAFPRGNLVLF